MNCDTCGNTLKVGGKFCGNCGAKVTDSVSNSSPTLEDTFIADKFTYIVFAKIVEDSGANISGVGAHPLYIFQNTSTDDTLAFVGSSIGEAKCFRCSDGLISEIIDQYVEYIGLSDFNSVTGLAVDKDYLNCLIISAVERDASDFEEENDVQTVLLDSDSGISDEGTLGSYLGAFGVWIMVRDFCEISFDSTVPSLIINDDPYDELEETFDILLGNADQAVLLLN